MNIVDIHKTIKLALPVGDHEYTGEKDGCHLRQGQGKEDWKKQQWRQLYTGQFLQDCLHNYGTYTWKNIDTYVQHIYEGKFFANNLEGYGMLSYPDGQIFEGLFKSNNRYGPGVLTHPDGNQDVGLWEGKHLVRLNQILPNTPIPQLAQSIQGKTYLLNFKILVPVQRKVNSPGNKILSDLQADETVKEKDELLYSKFVRNPKSTFFNKKLYCGDYFSNDIDWTINVVDSYDTEGVEIVKQVLVTHLLAWNNEDLALSFMEHSFKHRNYEKILTFNVSNILTGQRNLFRSPGPQETLCLQFLESCCQDETSIIAKLICDNNLYPDVTDFQGNNGIIYAAAYHQCRVIKILTNFGANVDNLNDECLTALTMSILRYTAYKYDIQYWELAFLPQDPTKDIPIRVQQWRTNNLTTITNLEDKEPYFFDLSCVHPIVTKKGKKDKKVKPQKESKISKKPIVEVQIIVDPKLEYYEKVLKIVICLLECGAKPNFGDTPFPPLILSVFARSPEIVEQLLHFGANANICTSSDLGSLTPLHIIASLAPAAELVPMATHLLSNGADPNLAANNIHWEQEKINVLAGSVVEDYGKTPLHILCMRYDFNDDTNDYLGELCSLLINLGAEPNMYYLGHMPLTLAIIRGNVRLMRRILNSGLVDPNQSLGNNMGVPVTVLILKRYESILPLDVCEEVYNCLLEYYANPLNKVPNFEGNTIEFSLKENFVEQSPKSKKSPKGKSPKSDKSSKSGKSSKKGKGGKVTGHQQVIQLLNKAAESTLIRHIQRKAVQNIYQYYIECKFEDPIFDVIVKFTDVENAVHNLQILLDYDGIIPCKTFCYDLLNFVESRVKTKKPKKEKSKGKKSKIPPRTTYDMVDELDFTKDTSRYKNFTFKIYMPEIDPNESKFKVCFSCFQKTNKTLLLCPKCNLVYFCSQECNIKDMKNKNTKHPCKFLFYNNELKLMLERIAKGLPIDEPNTFNRFQNLRKYFMETTNYLENIKNYDKHMTESRNADRAREAKAKDSQKSGRKGKGARKSRSTSRSSRATSKSARTDRKRSDSEQITKDRKGRSASKDKGDKDDKDRSASKGKGGKDRKASKDKGDKDRSASKDKKDKGGKSGKKGTADETVRNKKDKMSKGQTQFDQSSPDDEFNDDKALNLLPVPERRLVGSLPRWSKCCEDPVKKDFFSGELRDAISDICELFDYRFFQIFIPYCIFVDGSLYYKFDNINKFYKLTYSCT